MIDNFRFRSNTPFSPTSARLLREPNEEIKVFPRVGRVETEDAFVEISTSSFLVAVGRALAEPSTTLFRGRPGARFVGGASTASFSSLRARFLPAVLAAADARAFLGGMTAGWITSVLGEEEEW